MVARSRAWLTKAWEMLLSPEVGRDGRARLSGHVLNPQREERSMAQSHLQLLPVCLLAWVLETELSTSHTKQVLHQ